MRSFKITITGIVLLAVGVWWYGKEPGQYTIANEHPKGKTIIAFGDSITSGIGAPQGQSYPDQLSARLGVPVMNYGRRGDTTQKAFERLKRKGLPPNPGIVLLCLGGNDILRRLDTEVLFSNLEEIITQMQQQGAMVILLGVEGSFIHGYHGDEYEELARRMGCPYIPDILDGILGHPKLMSDRVHPNFKGYSRMVDRIEPVVKKYLVID